MTPSTSKQNKKNELHPNIATYHLLWFSLDKHLDSKPPSACLLNASGRNFLARNDILEVFRKQRIILEEKMGNFSLTSNVRLYYAKLWATANHRS